MLISEVPVIMPILHRNGDFINVVWSQDALVVDFFCLDFLNRGSALSPLIIATLHFQIEVIVFFKQFERDLVHTSRTLAFSLVHLAHLNCYFGLELFGRAVLAFVAQSLFVFP